MKLLFLDIDGVLNSHVFFAGAQSCDIEHECVDQLNRVILGTDCKIVISSAWRYMVHGGAMTLRGFEYMLRTHRLNVNDRIIGITAQDTDADSPQRWGQIVQARHQIKDVTAWCVLDDEPACFEESADWSRIVLTSCTKGAEPMGDLYYLGYTPPRIECPACGRRRLITSTGLVCSCGAKTQGLNSPEERAELLKAYPGMESRSPADSMRSVE